LELEEALFGNLNERDAKQLFDEFDKDGSSYDFIKGLSFTI
jgi:hypothetical protein